MVLRYHYSVVPEGLLPRFIVRTHPLSEGEVRWRAGVVLRLEGASALVRAEPGENRVSVTALTEIPQVCLATFLNCLFEGS